MTPFQASNKAYEDLTPKIPLYVYQMEINIFLVIYYYNSNAILAEVLKGRSGADMKNAYMSIYVKLESQDCAPSAFILDNKM